MNSNKLTFEQLFVREFSEMSSVILISLIFFSKKKRKEKGDRMQHFN